MTETKKQLIIISAPSGGGKTTLCQRLLEEFQGKLVLSISSTTRAPRINEIDGREYFFLPKEKFEAEIEDQAFAEWALVHGHYYGTSKKTIEDAISRGLFVLLEIDVQGAASLKEAFPGQCLTLFLAPPSLGALESRLRSRGTDSEEVIQKRILNAQEELKRKNEFDSIILNDDIDEAYEKLREKVSEVITRP